MFVLYLGVVSRQGVMDNPKSNSVMRLQRMLTSLLERSENTKESKVHMNACLEARFHLVCECVTCNNHPFPSSITQRCFRSSGSAGSTECVDL